MLGENILKAEIKGGYDHTRQRLAEIVPLEAPFTLFVSPTQICNFKCFYCTQSKSYGEMEKIGFNRRHMSNEMFTKIANDAMRFNGGLKRVLFTGLGEPLANPEIPNMIEYMKERNIAEGYEIITNAYLLTHEMTDRLLESGLTFLRVSIQGLTEEKYKEISGVNISYEKLLDNIKYFYQQKKGCKLYIKIMDACFDEGETEKDFFDMFGDICDNIYIEHLIKAQPSMMDTYDKNINSVQTFYGDKSEYRDVCPYAFYSLQVDVEGNTFPCPPLGFPEDFSLGNVMEKSIYDIWHSEKLYGMQLSMLKQGRCSVKYCDKCENYLCFTPPEDNLDNDRELIIRRIEEKIKCQK